MCVEYMAVDGSQMISLVSLDGNGVFDLSFEPVLLPGHDLGVANRHSVADGAIVVPTAVDLSRF